MPITFAVAVRRMYTLFPCTYFRLYTVAAFGNDGQLARLSDRSRIHHDRSIAAQMSRETSANKKIGKLFPAVDHHIFILYNILLVISNDS